jgi:hypothetical protein
VSALLCACLTQDYVHFTYLRVNEIAASDKYSSTSLAMGAGGFIVSEDDYIKDASSPSNLAVMVSVSDA